MSAGDLGDFGSPLPSYPTLPASPPKSEELSEQPLSDSTLHSTLHATSTTPASSRVLDSTHSPIPSEWGMTGVGGALDPVNWSMLDPLAQPALQLHAQSPSNQQVAGSGGDSLMNSSHDWASSINSLPSNSPNVATPTDIPIYATVKKLPKQQLDSPRQRTTSGSPFAVSTPPGASPSPGQPYSPMDTSSTMTLRMTHLENLCGKLTREKAEMAEEFGRQRKSFMNQMAQCDAKVSRYKHNLDKYSKEVQELSKVVLRKEEELQNVTIAAGITEATIRENFDADRIKYEEEVASLRKIVSVQSQDTNQAMQEEREVWQRENIALQAELEQLRRERSSGSSQPPLPPLSPQPLQGRAGSPEQGIKSPSPMLNAEEADLEISMNKAAEDTKILRAVVLPLEEEIVSLREKLKETESKVAEFQAQKEVVIDVPLIDLDSSLSAVDLESSRDLTSPIPTDTRELQNQLKLARVACNDLEMHTSQLKMQKTILQEEIKSLSEQLTTVSTDLEVERLNCRELRDTWKLANDHFIVSQDRLKQEIYRLHQKMERGEAVSPMREIAIGEFPSPTIVERSCVQRDGEVPARTHRRSWSTDEASDNSGTMKPPLQRLKSASWNSLHKSSETPSEDAEALSKHAKDLEEELLKVNQDLMHQRRVSANYERQLPRVQEQMTKDLDEKEKVIEKLKVENDKFKAHMVRQRMEYEKMCRQMDDIKEEMRTRIETFQENERSVKSQQRILKDRFTEIKQDTQREIAKMSEDRRDMCQQLERGREEFAYMKAIQNSCVTDYQAQLADQKQTCEELEAKLGKTTAQLSTTNLQLRQVREMLNADRTSKEKANSSLASQLEVAKRRIEELTPLVSRLDAEKTAKEEALAAKTATERKSRDFITGQNELIEKLNREKDRAETQVQELQTQMASLKFKLNHTEETQKDFVELSQSLQMKLAVMEEEIQKNQEQTSLSSPST